MKDLSLLITILCLALSSLAAPGWPQNRKQAERLYEEAQAADRNIRTWDQLEPKLIQALEIFEQKPTAK